MSFLSAATTFVVLEFDLLGFDVSLPLQMLCYLSAGLIGGVVAGLVTKRQDSAFLDEFFEGVSKPVYEVEVLESDNM